MRRHLLIVALAFGTLAGYGSGIAHLVHHHHHCGCPAGHQGEAQGADEVR
jgi:hypothetical protein